MSIKNYCIDKSISLSIQILFCLLSSVAPWSGLIVGTEEKFFEILVCRSQNAFFLESWRFVGSFDEI